VTAVDEQASSGDLDGRVRRGIRWSFVNTAVIRIGNFLTGVVLARGLLGPRDWGLYAIGLAVLAVLLSANELGVSLAIVRWEGDPRRFAPTVLTLSTLFSTLLYAVLFVVAPQLARALGSGDATGVLRVLGIAVVVDGISCVPAGMLNRTFAQRRRMLIDAANFAVSSALTIGLAAAGLGAMSFAWGSVAGNVVGLVGCGLSAPGFLRPGWDRTQARALIRYGLPLAGASMLVLLMLNVDSVVVGATLGPVALGLYQIAFNMSGWPVRVVSEVARRVSFAGFSRLAESDRVAEGFGRSLNVLMTASVPACVLLLTLARPLIYVVYGPRWTLAAGALSFLAMLGLLRVAFELAYDCLVALGRGRALILVQGWWLVALVPTLIYAARMRGIAGVGAGHILVAGPLVTPLFLWALARAGISPLVVLRACARPFVGGVLMVAITEAVERLSHLPALLELFAAAVPATIAYAAVIWRPTIVLRVLKRVLRRRFGWLPLYELRNRVLLAHTVPKVWRFENAEVSRLRTLIPPTPALVTTVIPTYRRPEQLCAAVQSALDQTVRDHRVIVVDDGAGLPPLPEDPRLIAVSLARNCAVLGVVRNVGIRLADSPYLAFLDDDNTWEPDHLATALAALEGDPGLAGVYTALRRMLPDGTDHDVVSEPFDPRTARERAYLDANAFVARRATRLRFSRLRRDRGVLPREDWATLYRYARRHRITHLPAPTVRYLVNPATYYTTWG
jgi:PST family polysaccharide transporter